MTKNNVGNNKFLKKYNQTLILNLLRLHKVVSRADLSSLTGLSPTAIGVIVSELLDDGFIIETGIGKSTGGRKPILVELKPNSFYSFGVDIDKDSINILAIDLRSTLTFERKYPLPKDSSFSNVLDFIQSNILHLISEYSIELAQIIGIGISIPGMINYKAEKIDLVPNLNWTNIDTKYEFSKLPKISVTFENEAMASAISENWIGNCIDTNNFICINIKSGIGSGIFINGIPFKGASGITGEVGHIVVSENGLKCGCGNYGCLETIASTPRILDKAEEVSILNSENKSLEKLTHLALDGNIQAKQLLIDSSKYLGIAISILVNVLNPEKIILGKDFIQYKDIVLDEIKNVVSNKSLRKSVQDLTITTSALNEKASVYGAAILPLKSIFGK